jgi:hypothetical protein
MSCLSRLTDAEIKDTMDALLIGALSGASFDEIADAIGEHLQSLVTAKGLDSICLETMDSDFDGVLGSLMEEYGRRGLKVL